MREQDNETILVCIHFTLIEKNHIFPAFSFFLFFINKYFIPFFSLIDVKDFVLYGCIANIVKKRKYSMNKKQPYSFT